VQGVLLYGLFSQGLCLSTSERRLLLIAATILVILVSLLSLKDRSDAKRHLCRLHNAEESHPKLRGSRWPVGSGYFLMCAAIVVLIVADALLLCWRW
jgi:hypothetical protein